MIGFQQRYGSCVEYWLTVNEIDSVLHQPFMSGGIATRVRASTAQASKRDGVIQVDRNDDGGGSLARCEKACFDRYAEVIRSDGTSLRAQARRPGPDAAGPVLQGVDGRD
ncbi:MAG: hypothetical protein JNL87_21435 [Burkholderiaceae bacterium]|nr:hypothetical protein [Burkholderiaceae bacterium]